MKLIKKFFLSNWPLLLVLTVSALLLSYNINKPFWGHHDWNGVYWGTVARNFARYGPVTTKFGMILNSGIVNPAQFNYNFHFLPLFTLIWSAFFAVFGVANWVSRFMAIIFSLGAIVVFYHLVSAYFSRRAATIACLFWIVTPMFIYFGKMPVHEIPLMFFVLAAFYFYLQNRYRPVLIFVILAELTTWPGFFLVPAITIHWWFANRKALKLFSVINLWLLSFLLFALHLTHDYLVTGSPFGGGLAEIFFLRVGGVAVIPYITTLARWAWTYYSLLLPLAFLWVVLHLTHKLPRHQDILILLLTFALFYPIIFRDASFRHDYLLIYFWPFLTLASVMAVDQIVRRRIFKILAVGLITLAMLALRFKYILALENSDIYKESVRFGQFIHDNSKPADKVFAVTADPTVPWDGWFIAYYADRYLQAGNSASEFKGRGNKVFSYLPGGQMMESDIISP